LSVFRNQSSALINIYDCNFGHKNVFDLLAYQGHNYLSNIAGLTKLAVAGDHCTVDSNWVGIILGTDSISHK